MIDFKTSRTLIGGLLVGLGLLGIAISTSSAPTALTVGTVYSSTQTSSQSFLRFYNSGTTDGKVTIALRDFATGQSLGQWTSPNIPAGSEQQYPIATIESGTGQSFTKPAFYSINIQTSITGYFQHVLYRPADGTLTNLSTCATGTTSDSAKLSAVHSTLLDYGFPSSVAVNNISTVAASATLGIYDANTGAKLGTYTTASVPANGQLIVAINTIETAIGRTPTSVMYHYVIKQEGTFTGFLQHLVNNKQAGVVTDMTTACALDGVVPTLAANTPVVTGTIFSSAQPSSQSFLRFYNTGATEGTVKVTLRDSSNGQSLVQWTSPTIPAGSEQQYPISTIESSAAQTFTKPAYYSMSVQSGISGSFQHVLYRPADGTLTNLSTCAAGTAAEPTKLSAVHSTLLDFGYPSSVAVNNTGSTAAAVTLGIYNANTGAKLGTYTTSAIPANGQVILGIKTIETALGITPTSVMYHYAIKAEGAFTGFLQHLVTNKQAGVVTDMTTTCVISATATFGELTKAVFSTLPPTKTAATLADAPNKEYALPYGIGTTYGFGNIFGNGRNDIVVAPTFFQQGPAISVEFWRNNGDGTFSNKSTDILSAPITTESVNNVFVADLNSDGRDDVFLVDGGWELPGKPFGGARNKLLLSGPDGKLTDASASLPVSYVNYNHKSAMADLNGDKCLDFVITEIGTPSERRIGIYFLMNDCLGRFTKVLDQIPIGIPERNVNNFDYIRYSAVAQDPYHVAAADLNGDGKVDLISGGTDQAVQKVSTRIYDGSAAYKEVAKLSLPAALEALSDPPKPISYAFVDVDDDGKTDIIAGLEFISGGGFFIVVYKNRGNFEFSDVTPQYLSNYDNQATVQGNVINALASTTVAQNSRAITLACGQALLSDILKGKCLYLIGPKFNSWTLTKRGVPAADQDIALAAPNASFTCSYRAGTPLFVDVDGDGVKDLVIVAAGCTTANVPKQTNDLQLIVFRSGIIQP